MEGKVAIVDGHRFLALSRIGDADPEYPRGCYPMLLEFSSDRISAKCEALSRSFPGFVIDLWKLHEKMTGDARLNFWNESHFLKFSGDGSGKITVLVEIREGVESGSRLNGELQIDQSCLPQLISDIERQFRVDTSDKCLTTIHG